MTSRRPRLRWSAAIACAVLACATACSKSSTAPSGNVPTVAPGTWAVLGSSTPAGLGASSTATSWVGRLVAAEAGVGVTVSNLAVAGATTFNWLATGTPVAAGRPAPTANNIDAVLALKPKLLLLAATTNDIAFGYTADETVANVTTVRAAALAGGAAVVVVGVQPRNNVVVGAPLSADLRAQLPGIDARFATLAGNCFVSSLTTLGNPDGTVLPQYNSGDGIHPNDAGHQVIFNAVDGLLQSGRCVAKPR